MSSVEVKTADGVVFLIQEEIIGFFGFIKKRMADNEPAIIPIEVSSKILDIIIKWAHYHSNKPEVEEEEQDEVNKIFGVSNWDATFLALEDGTLFDLIAATKYLSVDQLFETARKVMKMQSFTAIKKLFQEIAEQDDDKFQQYVDEN